MKRAHIALTGFGGMLALMIAVTADAQVVTAPPKPTLSLKAHVVKESKQKEEVVEQVFRALGPAFTAQLRAGRQVELPGVGSFRIVRATEYKDMVGGRPVVVPGRNYVEFIPGGDITDAVNAPGAVPARQVEGYDFRVNPSSTSGLKTEGFRTPTTRTR